jgi:hypothetical protein
MSFEPEKIPKIKPGRRAKLNNTTLRVITKGIAKGLTIAHSCSLAGISPHTYQQWKRRGRDEHEKDGRYKHFITQIKRAEAHLQRRMLRVVRDAALKPFEWDEVKTVEYADGTGSETVTTKTRPPQWTAAAWLLERKFPEEFGKVDQYKTDEFEPLPWNEEY